MLAATLALGALAGSAIASSLTSPVDAMNMFTKRISSGCSTSGPTSCHNTTRQTDLCCFESPGVRAPSSQGVERVADAGVCVGSSSPDPVLGHQSLDWPLEQLDHSRCVDVVAGGSSRLLTLSDNAQVFGPTSPYSSDASFCVPRSYFWIRSCDGTFTENCDSSRDYTDIAGVRHSFLGIRLRAHRLHSS